MDEKYRILCMFADKYFGERSKFNLVVKTVERVLLLIFDYDLILK